MFLWFAKSDSVPRKGFLLLYARKGCILYSVVSVCVFFFFFFFFGGCLWTR